MRTTPAAEAGRAASLPPRTLPPPPPGRSGALPHSRLALRLCSTNPGSAPTQISIMTPHAHTRHRTRTAAHVPPHARTRHRTRTTAHAHTVSHTHTHAHLEKRSVRGS